MDILVIGNGFDLAHGLPTTYMDFLKFTKAYENYKNLYISGDSLEETLQQADVVNRGFLEYFADLWNEHKDILLELDELIFINSWLKHFYKVQIKTRLD